MTIFIVGGSNSILKNGWTRRLQEFFPENEVKNLSIGATCSVTGLFRSLFTSNVAAGDTIIWEYALNDCNHVDTHGLSHAFILRHLEVLLAHCSRANIKFAALILKSFPQEAKVSDSIYHLEVKDTFRRWGVVFLDLSGEYRKVINVDFIPKIFYEGRNHYNTSSKIIDYIERSAVNLISKSMVPKVCQFKYAKPTTTASLLNDFSGEGSEIVGTTWFSHTAWKPYHQLTLKANFDVELTSVILFCGVNGGAIKIGCSSAEIKVSGTLPGPASMKNRLSPAFLDSANNPEFNIRENETVTITWSDDRSNLISGTYNKKNLTALEVNGHSASLLGLLVLRI